MSEDDSDTDESHVLEQSLTAPAPGVNVDDGVPQDAVAGNRAQGSMGGLGFATLNNNSVLMNLASEVMSPTMDSQEMLLRMYQQMQELQSEKTLLRAQMEGWHEGWETPRGSPLPKPSDGSAESSNIGSNVAGNAVPNAEKVQSPSVKKQSMTTPKSSPNRGQSPGQMRDLFAGFPTVPPQVFAMTPDRGNKKQIDVSSSVRGTFAGFSSQ